MRHPPIEVKQADGTTRTIMPFAKSWTNPEEEYARAQLGKKVDQIITAVPAYNEAAQPKKSLQRALDAVSSLRRAFYILYVEPVIVAGKMQAADINRRMQQKHFE